MLRVLIASDETVRAPLTNSLMKYGCQIVCTADANAVRTIVAQGRIDVCVLDWKLGGTSGAELCKWINSSGLKRPPYMIVLVPENESQKIGAAYRAGAHEFFVKPFDPEQVASRIF